MFIYLCTCVYTHGEAIAWCFLYCSPPYFLRQGLSLNPELTISKTSWPLRFRHPFPSVRIINMPLCLAFPSFHMYVHVLGMFVCMHECSHVCGCGSLCGWSCVGSLSQTPGPPIRQLAWETHCFCIPRHTLHFTYISTFLENSTN